MADGPWTARADGDRKFAGSLMDYYVGVLRADPAKVAKLCGR